MVSEMLCRTFILTSMWKLCTAVIYTLNESEYSKMPPLYEMDDYESCLWEPGGIYCVIDADLHSENSTLMRIIQDYSADWKKHFNHTQIHRGVCVTKKCKGYIRNRDIHTSEGLNYTLEACVNETIFTNYAIETALSRVHYCKRQGENEMYDVSDLIVGIIYIILISLNLVGSFYDILFCKADDKSGNPYFLAFSIRRNWRKLTAPIGAGPDIRFGRLKLFQGMRTMTMICVFFSHTVLLMAVAYVDNPLYIEKAYDDPLKQLLFNGSLVTHTFFVMSSFLLAYNFQIYAETHSINWTHWPKGILLRWLRLTPTYALVLATICTWMRHAGTGPLWDLVVYSEAEACRTYWWAHIIYVNNYIYDDAWCAPQTWYLAADTQLFCVGLLICVAARRTRAQKVVLLLLFIISLAMPAAHTYFQDLEAVVIQAPESYRMIYLHDDTFRLLYIRGHTNLSTYTLGLAGGFLTYNWQQEGKDLTKYKKYRWAYWMMFPIGVAIILSGGLFYKNGDQIPTAFRVLYATLYKPLFQLLVVILIVGSVFKYESVYRGILEWRGFAWTGRVSYSAFLLHTLFQRGLGGSLTMPTHMSDYYVLTVLTSTIFLSFLSAAALWLTVEAPAAALSRLIFTQRGRSESKGCSSSTCEGRSGAICEKL